MKNEKYTPTRYIDAVKNVLGSITLDPFSCKYANDHFVKAAYYFTKEISALDKEWDYKTVFMNPPYSNGEYTPAVEKFLEELERWNFEAITLTNNNTDTITTQRLMKAASAYCFPAKRINYHFPKHIEKKEGNRFGQLFCYFGNDTNLFRTVFDKFGITLINPDKLIF
jgi:hypothetical protein